MNVRLERTVRPFNARCALRSLEALTVCPWDGTDLIPLPDADPIALAFYEAIRDA